MRDLVCRTVATLVLAASASPVAAQSELELRNYPVVHSANFAIPASTFFSTTLGSYREYSGSGCSGGGPANRDICAAGTIQFGIEAGTGLGAIRTLLTQITTNGLDGIWFRGLQSSLVYGRVYDPQDPGPVGVPNTFVGPSLRSTEIVQRTTSRAAGNQWETFVPDFAETSLVYLIPCNGDPMCPNDRTTWEGGIRFRLTEVTATSTVPEPGTYALLGTGLAGLGLVARRRRSA